MASSVPRCFAVSAHLGVNIVEVRCGSRLDSPSDKQLLVSLNPVEGHADAAAPQNAEQVVSNIVSVALVPVQTHAGLRRHDTSDGLATRCSRTQSWTKKIRCSTLPANAGLVVSSSQRASDPGVAAIKIGTRW